MDSTTKNKNKIANYIRNKMPEKFEQSQTYKIRTACVTFYIHKHTYTNRMVISSWWNAKCSLKTYNALKTFIQHK